MVTTSILQKKERLKFYENLIFHETPYFFIYQKNRQSPYMHDFLEGKTNLNEANKFFEELKNKKNINCLNNKKLYYRIIEHGKKSTPLLQKLVIINYSIISPIGHCLSTQSNVIINLENTILGFQQGLQGIKIGETREIWIHPCLAYGFETSLDKCIYLKAIVTLIESSL